MLNKWKLQISLYLQMDIPKSPSSLSAADVNNMFITTPTNNIVPSIHVIGACIIMSTPWRSYLKIYV